MKIAFLIDAIQHIQANKDSSIALMTEALRRGYEVYYFTQKDIFLQNGQVCGKFKKIHYWHHIQKEISGLINQFDVVLMRKDPPVDMLYIYTTLLLDIAEQQGVKVINKPQSLRDINEKLFTSWFPQCCPETLVTSDIVLLKKFYQTHQDIILKPLNSMGGQGIFRLSLNDPNVNVIFETSTNQGKIPIIVQQYISAIQYGDKRVILMHGKPLPYAISRLAQNNDARANLAAGGRYIKATLTERDHWICEQVGDVLKQRGLLLVGLDIIGDYLTEINVTSPTCLQEIDQSFGICSASYFFDDLY